MRRLKSVMIIWCLGQIDLPSTLDAIKVILELMKDTDMAFQYENLLILFNC